LEAISQGLNVQPYEILVVGDHLNDLPMLERRYARNQACPSNAVEEVKAKILRNNGYVASKPTGEGTVEAWDYFFPGAV
jgi:hydroxymethylpyrimidine pyrophosphatase-like HAD family hydrolase